MKFYRFDKSGLYSDTVYTTNEVRSILQKKADPDTWLQEHYFLPGYQCYNVEDLAESWSSCREKPYFYPAKPLDTVEKLEQFLNPPEWTFVWDEGQWWLKIHTTPQLMKFWKQDVINMRWVDHTEEILSASGFRNYVEEDDVLYTLAQDVNSSAYKGGIFLGALIAHQSDILIDQGTILIGQDFSYQFEECPVSRYEYMHTSDNLNFPTWEPEKEKEEYER